MYRIAEFDCSNFKKIDVKGLQFKEINLLIGPNNAGKSSLLRAMSFASKMLSQSDGDISGFISEVDRLGGPDIPLKGGDSRDVSMRWLFKPVSGNHADGLDYRICFHVGNELGDVYMKEETLNADVPTHTYNNKPFNYFSREEKRDGREAYFSSEQDIGRPSKRNPIPVRTDEPILLQYDEIAENTDNRKHNLFSRLRELRTYLSRFFSYSSCNFDFDRVRELQTPNAATRSLSRNGANFINLYAAASQTDGSFETRYFNQIRSMIPDLTRIQLAKGLGKVGMKLIFGQHSFWLSEVSDGTIEALLLTLLFTLPRELAPTVLVLDEPEVNMHPAWQAQLASLVQTSPSFRQCFISTHSSDFLDAFTEQFAEDKVRIFVCGSKGRNTFETLDPENEKLKRELKKGWLLGELYRVNDPLIGGWPI